MTGEDYKRVGMGDYLEALQLWCMKEFPFNHEDVYKKLRSSALNRARFMIEHGKTEEKVIGLLKEKREKIVFEGLKYDPTSIFF